MASRVLIVEDDPADAHLIRDLLADDHTIETVNDGATAISTLESCLEEGSVPDLVLLDLRLPDIPGFEVLEFLRGDPDLEEITVVVLTNSSSDSDRERAIELGTDGYQTKPMDIDAFQRTITDIERTFLGTGT